MSLANYAAGAIMMPYAPFLEAAERHRYDIDRLCACSAPASSRSRTG